MPGEVLKRDFLKPRRITLAALAAATGFSHKHIGEIVHGRARITAEAAVRFARALATPPMMWLELQAAADLAQVDVDETTITVLIPGDAEIATGATPAAAAARLRQLRRGTTLPPGETIRSLIEFGRA
jgi:addiction module HigA family antidote